MSQITASHILVEKEHEAEDLLKKLAAGESFETLAKQYSQCPSGKQGGMLGTFGPLRAFFMREGLKPGSGFSALAGGLRKQVRR